MSQETDLLAQYRVADGLEVVALLKRLMKEKCLLTLYSGVGGQFLVTTLLKVDAQKHVLVLDFTTETERKNTLLSSNHGTVVGYLDSVKIQFDVNLKKGQVSQDGELVLALPGEMFRIQRRSAYRARPLASQPATCWMANPEAPGQREPMRLLDISLGGVAIMTVSNEVDLKPGVRLEHCVIELPGHDRFSCDLIVRYVDEGGKGLTTKRRCGCEFLGLSGSVLRLIQVYVNEVEQARRAQALE